MNDETKEKFYKLAKILLIVANLLLVGSGIYHTIKSRSSTTDVYQDTVGTVERIKGEHELTRSEVESAERSTIDAEKHVERAADAISRSQDAASRNAAGIDQLQTLVSECQGIVTAQQRLIRNIDESSGTRQESVPEN